MKLIHELQNTEALLDVRLSRSTRELVTLDSRGKVQFWTFPQLVETASLQTDKKLLRGVEISNDGNYLVVVALDGSLVFSRNERGFDESNVQNTSKSFTIAFTPDSQFLLLTIADQILSLKKLGTRDYTDIDESLNERNYGFAFHPDGYRFVLASCAQGASELMFYDLRDLKYRLVLTIRHDELSPPAWSGDGRWVAVSHHGPVVYSVTDAMSIRHTFDSDGKKIERFEDGLLVEYKRLWTRSVFQPARNTMLTGSPDGKVFRWDLEDGVLVDQVQAHEGRVLDISMTLDEQLLVSCGQDKYLRVWEI
jgi:WD40 repeat protein